MEELRRLFGWINVPFTQPLSPVAIFFMVLIVMIAFGFWSRILAHMNLE